MLDHVKFGASDYESSKSFFLRALAPLGVVAGSEGPPSYGIELYVPDGNTSLCIFQTKEAPAHLHLAFVAADRKQVETFYRAALGAGGKDNGPPGLRRQYGDDYFAAFVIGPDGHNVEAVCHEGEACTPRQMTAGKVAIVEYRASWPSDFEAVAGELRRTLGDKAARVDHIGSTSVPSLCAKDIVDVQVTVDRLNDEICQRLLQAGFVSYREPRRLDHVPPGFESRPEDWAKLFFKP